ncbi:MAG: alpha/beta fold hydrolase [Candidatus Binataceae bacterium]
MASNLSPEPRSGYVNLNGLRLHYLDWGGDGTPIVILHATGFFGRLYRPIAEALTAIGRVYTLDQRGHGDSDQPAIDACGWDFTVRDLEGFILAMDLGHVRGLGHSAGATAIGALASQRSDLVTRAVLVEPVIFDSGERTGRPDDLRERTLKRRRSFDSVEAMFASFASKPPYDTWRKDMLHDYCEYGTRADGDSRRVLKCPPEIEAAVYGSAHDFDGLGYILKCQAPLLVMFGAESNTEGVTLGDTIMDRAPHRRVVTIPATSHFMPMERPDIVVRMAADFMRAD